LYILKYIVKPPLWGNFERRSEVADLPSAGGSTLVGWLVMIALIVVALFAYNYIKTKQAT